MRIIFEMHCKLAVPHLWSAQHVARIVGNYAGLDQTRGWFYTLMVLSTALFGKPAFRNLVCNGLVLAADGKKMSKRLKNYPVRSSCFLLGLVYMEGSFMSAWVSLPQKLCAGSTMLCWLAAVKVQRGLDGQLAHLAGCKALTLLMSMSTNE